MTPFFCAAIGCGLLWFGLGSGTALAAPEGTPWGDAPPAQTSTTRLAYNFRGMEMADAAWLKQAAEQGYAAAQFTLARNYRQGKGVERDLGQQLIWLTKAAKSNLSWAAYELGRVYETGEGVAANEEVARRWYRQAAEQNLIPAIKRLADLKDGEDGGKSWQKLYETKSALDVRFYDLLRQMQGGKLSDGDSYRELEKLGRDGHLAARQEVAARLLQGKGVERNVEEGVRQLEALEQLGWNGAAYVLGEQYVSGKNVARDFAKAAAYLKKAADANQLKALTVLASLYEQGNGVPQDMTTALMHYRAAAEQGEAFAQTRLGAIYENGFSVAKDRDKALYWYKLAAQSNQQAAKDAVARLSGQPGSQPASTTSGSMIVVNPNSIPDLRTQAFLLNVDAACKNLSADERAMMEGFFKSETDKQRQDGDKLLADSREQALKVTCGNASKNLLRTGVTANLRPRYLEFRNKDGETKYWSMLMPSRLVNRRCNFFGEEKAQELDRLATLLDQRILERVKNNQTLSMAIAMVEEEFANFANKSACDAKAKQMVENAIKMSNTVAKRQGQEF